MEAHMHHPQDTGLHMGEGHGQVHDEGEHHHHKKSVLKKVKAKAKKIKDTLKHGLGHEHEHEHHHEEEEETDDEEMEEGGEVHGGSYAIRSKTIPKEDILGKQTGNLENPASQKEDRYDTTMKDEDEGVHKPILQRQDEFSRPPSMGDTHFPQERQRPQAAAEKTHETKGNDREGTVLEPYPPHFRGDMHDPVTATEKHRREDVDHEITGFEPYDAPHSREEMHRPPSVVETLRTKGIDHVTGHGRLNDQGAQGHKIGALAGIQEDPHAPKDPMANPNDSNYQSKVADPTGVNNEEAGVSPIVRSFEKMGVDETIPDQGAWQLGGVGGTGDTNLDQGTKHSQYTGSHDQFAPQQAPAVFPSVPKDTESLPKSMDPTKPEDSPQDTFTGKPGSYTEKISSATSVIADKAVTAKNVVASKLGYGGTAVESSNLDATGHDKGKTMTTSATELAQKAASKVAETLAPVYEKVAGAGSTVMAKVQGTAAGVTGHADAEDEGNTRTTDKGVSMKEYLAEKFKPGEEDKALSEVISGSLSRQKEKTEETGATKPMGKVTVSEEVERKLGPVEDLKKEDGVGDSGGSVGQGVVDRVKDAVSMWLGKAGEVQTSSVVINNSAPDGGAVGGRGA